MPRRVSLEEARRIAVRAQLLDGSARGVLETVRRLGFLQLDPIATVARPQHLVLWSRLGSFDTGELDRLLWVDRLLFEWNAFIWPIEALPLVRARMRHHRRASTTGWDRWVSAFLRENASFRRYVVRELERRGPLLGRELDDRARGEAREHRWYGSRRVGQMLEILHSRGHLAVVGRRGGQRVWDLAERWYPETEVVPLRDATRYWPISAFERSGSGCEMASGKRIPPPTMRLWRTASRCCRRSTDSFTTGSAPRRCSGSAIGSRCTCRPPSASTATTSCRSSSATVWSGGPSRVSIGRPGLSSCSAPGVTPRGSTKRSPGLPLSSPSVEAAVASANLGEADHRDGVVEGHLAVVELPEPPRHVIGAPDLGVVVLDLAR